MFDVEHMLMVTKLKCAKTAMFSFRKLYQNGV